MHESQRTGELLSTAALCRLSGATFRQVDYWARVGDLTPEIEAEGSGSARGWRQEQVTKARVLRLVSEVFDQRRCRGPQNFRRMVAVTPNGTGRYEVAANGIRLTIEVEALPAADQEADHEHHQGDDRGYPEQVDGEPGSGEDEYQQQKQYQ